MFLRPARPLVWPLILATAGVLVVWQLRQSNRIKTKFEFANQAPGTGYVGDAVCMKCHSSIAASYARTAMGRSWHEPDKVEKIEDYESTETVRDDKRGFYYRAFQEHGRFFQEEFRLDAAGAKVHSQVREIRYAVGSGQHGRSYLAEHNGYLTMLPIGWYSEAKQWDLSPGFHERNRRFDREVPLNCTLCHNSYPEHIEGSVNRYRLPLPTGIGCERCHGPGELHVQWQQSQPAKSEGAVESRGGSVHPDRTILNPRHLPVDRRDDICSQCHLQSDISFSARGKELTQYRPGERLGDYRRDFFVQPEDHASFGFSSHVPRMRMSACWSKGDAQNRLTCTTCHDPHVPIQEVSVRYFVERCLDCHGAADCSRPAVSKSSSDNCIECHMVKGPPKNMAHTVFTDHWIRKPSLDAESAPPERMMPDPNQPIRLIDFWSREAPAPPAEQAIALARFLDKARWTGKSELSRAERWLVAEAQLDPAHTDLHFWRGAILEMLGTPDRAAAAYERAAQQRQDDPLLFRSLGGVYRAMGRQNDAARVLQRAIQVCPDYLPAYVDLAAVQEAMRNHAAAMQSLDDALARNPYLTDAAMQRAQLLFESTGASDATLEAVKRTRTLDPDRPDALWLWASVQAARGARDEAIEALKTLQQRDPKSVPVLGALATIYVEQGHGDLAAQILEELRVLTPGHPAIGHIERKLREQR